MIWFSSSTSMEHQSISNNSNHSVIEDLDAEFHDALEEFPFVDASNSFEESNQSTSGSNPDTNDDKSTVTFISDHSLSSTSSSGLRRRRLVFPRNRNKLSESQSIELNPHNHTCLLNSRCNEKLNSTTVNRSSNSHGSSAITSISDFERVSDESGTVESPNLAPGLLFIITELVIDVLAFQTKLLLNSIKFLIRLIYSSYMLFNNPYNIIRLGRSGIWGICYNTGVKLINSLWFQNNESALKLCVRIGWGLLWLAYCGFILVCLLVLAFVISAVIVKRIVEEPVMITEQLVFDYTKDTPVAFAPVISCSESSLLVYKQKSKIGSFVGTRVVPFGHELKATVSLVLPESDYNRKLGIFQVKVDFLSNDDKLLTTTRKPCMLQFKSDPIRLFSTFLKLPSLLTGYPSETQTLDININGYTEKHIPLSCLRVVIEQRAEFAKGAGVPEIYSAFIKLESRFSLLKRMLWYWKWLIYIWISIMMSILELLFTVLCCTPVIFLWVRRVGGNSFNVASHGRNKPPG